MRGFAQKLVYERTDLGDENFEDQQRQAAEMATAKWVGELLNREYPGHPWYVEVKIGPLGGVIQLQLRPLMGDRHWYVVKMSDVISDPGGKRTVLKGAGEILERYNLPRRGFSADDFRAALLKAPITGRGHLEPLL